MSRDAVPSAYNPPLALFSRSKDSSFRRRRVKANVASTEQQTKFSIS
jgi:hypothetical protein